MQEKSIVLVLSVILITIGISSLIFFQSYGFNFYKSELKINGNHVFENIYFKPGKSYHTLYRNFVDPIYSEQNNFKNYVDIISVKCSEGNSYFKDYFGNCNRACFSFTEPNEYGCTFGNGIGFYPNNEYIVSAEYELFPENLYKIKDNYYIKFVAYSSNRHKLLSKENFFISGNVIMKDKYYKNENVILYIPFDGDLTRYNILEKDNFEFDSSNIFFMYLLAVLPGILFFSAWYFFGRENSYSEIPEQISAFPEEKKFRKAWEVASYFNPPFSTVDKNFFSSVLLNFYHKKILDVKLIKKEIYIKLNKKDYPFDKIESQVFNILVEIKKNSPLNYFEGEYFNLKKSSSSFITKLKLRSKVEDLRRDVRKEGNKFLSHLYLSPIIFMSCFFTLFVSVAVFRFFFFIPTIILFMIFFSMSMSSSALFIKFKKDFYLEYQHWQAFKKYLDRAFTIKTGNYKTVIIWDDYLIYSTALGVSKKVIKELRAKNLLNQEQYNLYVGINKSFSSFSSNAGGGHAGAGGGGVGGGGGGGR
ncbi:MAG: DUF2207 family protein [Nanoarchaeota archaeon]